MNLATLKKAASPIALCAALAVILCTGVTLAYLTDSEGALRNTLSIGSVSVTLSETDTALDGDGNALTNAYAIAEGGQLKASIPKDPRVTVPEGSADCWLFVKLEESGSFDDYLGYEVADGWTALDEVLQPGVFYREVLSGDEARAFPVLKGDAVAVDADTTLAELRALEAGGTAHPSLEVTAFAVQKGGLADAAAAWELVGE